MGGHGALICALKNPDRYRSLSAFAPISAPMRCPGARRRSPAIWATTARPGRIRRDASSRRRSGWRREVLVDQGTADDFLEEQLKPELLQEAFARGRHPAHPALPGRLRPQLLLHRELHRRPPRPPRAAAQGIGCCATRAPSQLYEADFYAWTRRQATALRRFARTRPNLPLDLEHIAEEIQDLGKSERDTVVQLGPTDHAAPPAHRALSPRPSSGGTGWTRSTSSALR